jgi:high-affinity iron transporter
MGQMLMVTLREGIEAFLIVAMAATYLRKTGRGALLPALAWGTGSAVLLSGVLGVFLAEWAVVPLHEGILALVAAVLVLSMVAVMLRAAKHMRAEISARLEAAAVHPGGGAWLGVFLFALIMITREGMEVAFITASLVRQSLPAELVTGAVLGVLLAAALAWMWVRFGQRINLGLFFQVTSLFLALFALQLLFYAFHEFTEANAVPLIDNTAWHLATEDWAEGIRAQVISALLVGLPLAWLAVRLALRTKPARVLNS